MDTIHYMKWLISRNKGKPNDMHRLKMKFAESRSHGFIYPTI